MLGLNLLVVLITYDDDIFKGRQTVGFQVAAFRVF